MIKPERVYFQNERERSLYEDGLRFGLVRDMSIVSDEVLSEREAWVYQQGIAIAMNPSG